MKIEIKDDFLNKEDLLELSHLNLEIIKDDEVKVYHNKIFKNGEIESGCIEESTIKRLNDRYHSHAMQTLSFLYPEKCVLYDYSEFHIINTGKNYKFPIHDDTPDKLLSGVIYLKPEKNAGTIFYNSKSGGDKKVIDWKVNRAVFFSRKERETWHSYEGDKINNRLALVYNLMTTRIRDVFKVEKKNYLFGSIRFKINPYLYQYFKFTI